MAEYPKIILAIWKDDYSNATTLLYDHQVVFEIDPDGRTPLMAAVIDGKIKFMKLLIQSGSDVNYADPDGWTSLHFSAQNYSYEVCEVLLKNGADVDCRDQNGNTPLFRALMSCQNDPSVLKLLIDNGANIHSTNNHGVSLKEIANGNDYEQLFV